jgi:hypothetical protein
MTPDERMYESVRSKVRSGFLLRMSELLERGINITPIESLASTSNLVAQKHTLL